MGQVGGIYISFGINRVARFGWFLPLDRLQGPPLPARATLHSKSHSEWSRPLKQRLQLRFNSVCVFKPDNLVTEYALAVIEQRGGQAFNAAKLLLQVVGGNS